MLRTDGKSLLAASSLAAFLVLAAEGCEGTSGTGAGPRTGDSGATEPACSYVRIPSPPASLDLTASVQVTAETQNLAILDKLIGQYLRGDVLVYRGTIQGHSSVETPPSSPAFPDGTIAAGPGLAALDFRAPYAGEWVVYSPPPAPGNVATLMVHGLAEDKYMIFQQAESQPSITATAAVASNPQAAALDSSCSDCAPSFWDRPAAIAFDLTTTGAISDGTGDTNVPVHTMASASLVIASTCSLHWDDLAVLDTAIGPGGYISYDVGLADFVSSGGEAVWHVSGWIETASPSAHGICDGRTVPYTLDLFVNLADLGDYGVRNYVENTAQPVCWI